MTSHGNINTQADSASDNAAVWNLSLSWNLTPTNTTILMYLCVYVCVYVCVCMQWRSNRGFSRFKEPGRPTVRGPDCGHNLFYLQGAKSRIQTKPKSASVAHWLFQRPVLTYCTQISVS